MASSQYEFLLHDDPVLVEPALQAVDLSFGADPQLLAHHANQAFVVANENDAALKERVNNDLCTRENSGE